MDVGGWLRNLSLEQYEGGIPREYLDGGAAALIHLRRIAMLF